MLRTLLEISRISNIPTVWSNVLAAWLIGRENGTPPPLVWLLLGASFLYTGGMWLNYAADATWDRSHKPDRPIPSGRIAPTTAWFVGLTSLVGGAILLVSLGQAHASFTLALVIAVLAYDLYHKPWAGSVVVMGACRTLLWLAVGGGAALTGGLVLGSYIIGLTLLARAEGKGSLTQVQRIALIALLAVPLLAVAPTADGILLAIVFVVFIGLTVRHLAKGGPAIGQGVGWLLAGIPLVDALSVIQHDWAIALAMSASVPLLRYWQRFVAAT
jgi:UbiA prenyltransferase family